MSTVWARSRAFIWAIGGHALLIGLLLTTWQQPMTAAKQGQGEVPATTAVEATLVTAPPQDVAPQPAVTPPSTPPSLQPPPVPPIEPRTVLPDAPNASSDMSSQQDVKPVPEVAKQSPPTVDTARTFPAPEPPSPAGNPSAESSSPAPESDDPYAEMRRQRAQAERTYQLSQQALRQQADQHAAVAAVAPQQVPPLPTFPFAGGPVSPAWPADLQSSAMLFDPASDPVSRTGQPGTPCAPNGFLEDGEYRLDARVNCLLGLTTPIALTPSP